MENAIPPEERAAASDVSPVPMEPSATREIRERVWLEMKYMIGSEEEDAECSLNNRSISLADSVVH